jgi:hypothetical protein
MNGKNELLSNEKARCMSRYDEEFNALGEVHDCSTCNDNKKMEENVNMKFEVEESGLVENVSQPTEATVTEHEVNSLGDSTACQQVKGKKMKEQVTDNHGEPCTIYELWLSEFKSKINAKYYNDKFDSHIIRLLDEHREAQERGIYNTTEKLVARRRLAHLKVQARKQDEYDPARMPEVVTAYQGYHEIMHLLVKRLGYRHLRNMNLNSVPFFVFIVRDLLTRESYRIIREDPVIAALKIAISPTRITERLGSKDKWIVAEGIRYIQNRMASKVTSELAAWCHETLPAEAERCGLPKEPVRNEFEGGGRFELLYSLDGMDLKVVDDQHLVDLWELKSHIEKLELLIDDNHVFYFDTEDYIENYYLLYASETGKYYKQHINDRLNCRSEAGLTPVDDNETLAAILDTGISPILILESDINTWEVAA